MKQIDKTNKMKKAVPFAIIGILILSIVPFAFAERESMDTSANVNAVSGESMQLNTSNERAKEKLEPKAVQEHVSKKIKAAGHGGLKVLNEEEKAKIEDLNEEKQQRFANLSDERLQKIAELDKMQIERLANLDIKNIDKIAQLKNESLERISRLSEDKIERLSELDQDKLEKVADLNETDVKKFAALDRARLAKLSNFDDKQLRAELKNLKIMKVRNAEDLDKRNISEADMEDFTQKYEQAQLNFTHAREGIEDSKRDLNEAMKGKDDKKILEYSRDYMLKTADTLANQLEKIKSKVQQSKNIQPENVTAIVAQIDAEISKINEIKTQVDAAATKDKVKEAAKNIRDELNNVKSISKLFAQNVVSSRVDGIIHQGTVLEKRLDSIISKAKENWINVSVDEELKSFSGKIDASNADYAQAQAKLSEAISLRAQGEPADSDKIKALNDEANRLLSQARDSLKEAYGILKTIIKKIKSAYPDAELSSDTEVEVAQEIHSSSANNSAGAATEGANATQASP